MFILTGKKFHSLRAQTENAHNHMYTAISRKVVGKSVHATIPKGNMGYDQYNVPDDCSCRTYFCCFPLALANTFPWPFVPILSNFFEKKENLKPPTMPFRIVACTFPDNLSRNSCIMRLTDTGTVTNKKRFKESTVRLPKQDRRNKRTLIVYNQSDISS